MWMENAARGPIWALATTAQGKPGASWGRKARGLTTGEIARLPVRTRKVGTNDKVHGIAQGAPAERRCRGARLGYCSGEHDCDHDLHSAGDVSALPPLECRQLVQPRA